MRTEFDVLDIWSEKQKVGITNSKKDIAIVLNKNAFVINPEKYQCAYIQTFDPRISDDTSEEEKKIRKYLKTHNLETFGIIMMGYKYPNLVKPIGISLKDYLEL